MKRREFILALGGGAAAWPLAARAQQAERVRKAGVLAPAAAGTPLWQGFVTAFREGLQKLGWSPRNVAIQERWGANAEQVRSHAAELVAMAPDVLMSGGGIGHVTTSCNSGNCLYRHSCTTFPSGGCCTSPCTAS